MNNIPESVIKIKKPVYIICAAILYQDGKKHQHQPINVETGLVIAGRRHHNCFVTLLQVQDRESSFHSIQGFITSDDRFVDREEAYKIALEAGQIKDERGTVARLMSEDLY